MEQIPEIKDNEFGIYISKRYQGGFEVSVSYGGLYVRRYTLVELTGRLLSFMLNHVPVIGLWPFSRDKRKDMVERIYALAINEFIHSLKLDIGSAIVDQEGSSE